MRVEGVSFSVETGWAKTGDAAGVCVVDERCEDVRRVRAVVAGRGHWPERCRSEG